MTKKLLTVLMTLVAGSALAGDAVESGSPMIVAGGNLDPAYPDADVYLDTPEPPSVPPGACGVAARYVALINAGKYREVAALYADDATFLEPRRPTLRGRKEIDNFYTLQIGEMQPTIAPVSYLGNERECMVALALKTAIDGRQRYVLVSVDHFILGENGKITSMTAFGRTPRKP